MARRLRRSAITIQNDPFRTTILGLSLDGVKRKYACSAHALPQRPPREGLKVDAGANRRPATKNSLSFSFEQTCFPFGQVSSRPSG